MSNAPVSFLGTPGFIRDPERFSDEEIQKILGENSGNLMFQYAASSLINQSNIYISPAERAYDDRSAIDPSRFLIFPAANHLRLGADWTLLNNFLEGAGKPLIVLGLGAQSPKLDGEKETINALKADAGIRRMVDIFRDRGALITVRGAFSMRVCAALGLERVEILGCPSALLNPDPELGRKLETKLLKLERSGSSARLGVTAAAPFEIINDAPRGALERRLISLMAASQGVYVQQSGGLAAIRFASGQLEKISDSELASIYTLLGADMPPPQFWNAMGRAARFYTSAPQWIGEMRNLDLVVGTRLHGAMAAIAAGAPGAVIAHDSRTSELIDFMRLPNLSMEAAMAVQNVSELARRVDFDGWAFDRRRNHTARRLRDLLRSIGVNSAIPLADAVDRTEAGGFSVDVDESGRVFHNVPQGNAADTMPVACDR